MDIPITDSYLGFLEKGYKWCHKLYYLVIGIYGCLTICENLLTIKLK